METISVTTPIVDRQAIRAELEQTRAAFQALLARVPDDAWEHPTSNPAWNNRQLLYHIVMAVEMFHYLSQHFQEHFQEFLLEDS